MAGGRQALLRAIEASPTLGALFATSRKVLHRGKQLLPRDSLRVLVEKARADSGDASYEVASADSSHDKAGPASGNDKAGAASGDDSAFVSEAAEHEAVVEAAADAEVEAGQDVHVGSGLPLLPTAQGQAAAGAQGGSGGTDAAAARMEEGRAAGARH